MARRTDTSLYWRSDSPSSESLTHSDSWTDDTLGNRRACSLSALGAVSLWKRRSRRPPIFSRKFAPRKRLQPEARPLRLPKPLRLRPRNRHPLQQWLRQKHRYRPNPQHRQRNPAPPQIFSRQFERKKVVPRHPPPQPPYRRRPQQHLPLRPPRLRRRPLLLVQQSHCLRSRRWCEPRSPALRPLRLPQRLRLSLRRCRPNRCLRRPRRGPLPRHDGIWPDWLP